MAQSNNNPNSTSGATGSSSRQLQLEKLLDMHFTARLVLGSCAMEIGDILTLGQGAVLEFDTPISEPLKLYVDDHMIAKAESVVVNERFGARIKEITPREKRLQGMSEQDES